MVARSPHEAHRAATPLELFFDLVFVVAIAKAAAGLHHAVAELHAVEGLIGYKPVNNLDDILDQVIDYFRKR